MSNMPVHVVTLHDARENSTDTAGGFTDLADAKEEAASVLNGFHGPHQFTMFIETWHGGAFVAHRELRRSSDPHAHDEWWLSEAPSFTPIKEN